jgi:hypothetical protein
MINRELSIMYYLEISKELYRLLIPLIISSMLAKFMKWMPVVFLHFLMALASNRKDKRTLGNRLNYGLINLNLMMRWILNLLLMLFKNSKSPILMNLMTVKIPSKTSMFAWLVILSKKRNSKVNLDLYLLSFIIVKLLKKWNISKQTNA